jgi:HSP20 family molecular chaperone IbpA
MEEKNVAFDMKKGTFCVRAPEYLGCYTLPYKVESGREEIRFEGGLLKVFVPISKGLEQKRIYRPLA